jgi:hypothetical protein
MDISIGAIKDIDTIFSNDCVAQASLAALNQPLLRVAGPATAITPVVNAAIAILSSLGHAGIIGLFFAVWG